MRQPSRIPAFEDLWGNRHTGEELAPYSDKGPVSRGAGEWVRQSCNATSYFTPSNRLRKGLLSRE